MNICIIPARGNSKRISRKNIKHFCGKPIIAWSIETARNSDCFARIMVSTDNPEIAAIAQEYGAETPFIRPESLADDHTGTIPVISHAVKWLYDHNIKPLNVCCLYATAPFVQPNDLQLGLSLLESQQCDYTLSVTSFPFPIQRALRLTQQLRIEMFQPEHFQTRSQDLEESYHDAGQYYWGKASAWLNKKALFSNNSAPVVIPRHRVQDIDTLEDWERATWMFKAMRAVEEQS